MIKNIDCFRTYSKGNYDNDLSFLNYNSAFPSKEVKDRNAVYRFRHRQYTGEYARNKNLIARINGIETEIQYKIISTNYFKLLTNKMGDLIFNNEISVKTGDIIRDKDVNNLVERTNFFDAIRKAFKMCTEYGDSCLKVNKFGVSAFTPLNCFKVVDESDITKTIAYVLYEFIYDNYNGVKNLKYIRFEIHVKGCIYECARDYIGTQFGGTIGSAVSIKYKGRVIPKEGSYYETGVDDCELVQMFSINQQSDGVYGESLYQDIQDIIFAIEQRISVNQHLLDNSMTPFIVVGAEMLDSEFDGETGKSRRRLKLIDGKYMVSNGEATNNIKSVELNYNLDNSEHMLNIMQSFLYELSEMGKTYLSGEYGGNISEETLNNTIKSAIDKGNRLITEVYTQIRNALYCLCKLNDIAINIEDININFNVGRTDDDSKISEICKTLIENKILSRATVREKYFGYNKEQSDNEDKQIELENSSNNTHYIDNNEDANVNMENKDEENNNETMEVKQNEVE